MFVVRAAGYLLQCRINKVLGFIATGLTVLARWLQSADHKVAAAVKGGV